MTGGGSGLIGRGGAGSLYGGVLWEKTENTIQDSGTTRKKFQPVRMKEMLAYSDRPRQTEQPLSVRKRIEPMRVKDLLKSLSARKNPESAKVPFSSKSAERNINVSRQSAIISGTDGKNVRRKLYATQNTPKELNHQTKLFPNPKTQQKKTTADVNRNQTSRKSFLLPPNSIKEYYVRKGLGKGKILEASREDVSVQTSNELFAETSNNKPNGSTLTGQYIIERSSEMPSSQLSAENGSINNAESITNVRSVNSECEKLISTNSRMPFCVADTTENRIETESTNGQSEFSRPSVVTENGYSFCAQPLLANQVLLQVPHDVENSRISLGEPIVNSTCDLELGHIIVERNNLLSIEAYLKEGIGNLTQALNLVQATLRSNSFGPQVQSTVLLQKENNAYCSAAPLEQCLASPILETIEMRDIKIEPTYGDTSPPSALPFTPTTSEIQSNSNAIKEDSTEPLQMKSLQVRLENCLLKPPNKCVSKKVVSQISESQEALPTIEDSILTSSLQPSKGDESQLNVPKPPRIEKNLLRTPKRTSRGAESNLLRTPKTIGRNLLMTPCRTDNKENFQTPMSRRKTFSGLDSQNLRRSVRIARHHLRQSLGDDSFLALERELNIVYPQPKI